MPWSATEVPLLDIKRCHKLLAGRAGWLSTATPDKPEDWAVISRYSPYQNVKRDGGYAAVHHLDATTAAPPDHARKMVARLRDLGQPVLYYENIEGRHGGAADNEQRHAAGHPVHLTCGSASRPVRP